MWEEPKKINITSTTIKAEIHPVVHKEKSLINTLFEIVSVEILEV